MSIGARLAIPGQSSLCEPNTPRRPLLSLTRTTNPAACPLLPSTVALGPAPQPAGFTVKRPTIAVLAKPMIYNARLVLRPGPNDPM